MNKNYLHMIILSLIVSSNALAMSLKSAEEPKPSFFIPLIKPSNSIHLSGKYEKTEYFHLHLLETAATMGDDKLIVAITELNKYKPMLELVKALLANKLKSLDQETLRQAILQNDAATVSFIRHFVTLSVHIENAEALITEGYKRYGVASTTNPAAAAAAQ